MPHVVVSNVSKSFNGIEAVKNVSFEVDRGEYVGVIGPSGCGKTTLLKIIAGIISPDRGEVYINGKAVGNVPPEDRGVGMIFQDILLFPHMEVWENVIYSPIVRGIGLREAMRRGRELMDMLKVSIRARSYPRELSRGLQQKVAVARSLLTEANLLLFDEPLSSLDYRVRLSLRYELRRMVKDLGLTAIHVTHDQDEAMSVSDKIIVMRNGGIEQIGKPLEVYFEPRNLFVAKFIGGECNFIAGKVERVDDGYVEVGCEGDLKVRAATSRFDVGDKVILAVKPEHFKLVDGAELNKFNIVVGRVKDMRYLGLYDRVEILSNDVKIVAKVPRVHLKGVRVGCEITLKIPVEAVRVFSYPAEGLEEATRIE